MKKLALLALSCTFCFSAFATEIGDIDRAISRTIGDSVQREGVSSDGIKCTVSAGGGQVSILSHGPGCVDPSTSAIDTDCLSSFETQFRKNTVKKIEISDRLVIAEVKTKDDEQYSSSVTTKIKIEVGNKTKVTVYSKKGLFGYNQVLDCSI
jgi:hypothetical protein